MSSGEIVRSIAGAQPRDGKTRLFQRAAKPVVYHWRGQASGDSRADYPGPSGMRDDCSGAWSVALETGMEDAQRRRIYHSGLIDGGEVTHFNSPFSDPGPGLPISPELSGVSLMHGPLIRHQVLKQDATMRPYLAKGNRPSAPTARLKPTGSFQAGRLTA